ncbi:MAG TPA: FAD-dependent oxidoreductase [Burkholderiaceae bacterium]|jgi:NADPH-dependent 2,4-dienoyl-CoA reductase/sulfur reductase-like enzyme/nitrite reductase/ring-hydroxylating ferredoxin subunit|nr:FAD-dependent oxidoreductase [Burkholderiaceae bacterium]
MSDTNNELAGPDLCKGVALSTLAESVPLLGHAQGEPTIVVRRGAEVFAIGAVCTHYSGPLAEGLVEGDAVRCPWHHACFSLRTGEALRAPALNPVACRKVELRDGMVYVGDAIAPAVKPPLPDKPGLPKAIVIIGGGAAGNAAAETLRREGYAGRITLLSADSDLPCDRPNLSKSYLAGTAQDDWIPLRSAEFYREQRIDIRLAARVADIDTKKREVALKDGTRHAYDALLLATGADPVRLGIPGMELPHVHLLRTWADSRALAAAAAKAKRAVVIGASFIGLEVAASLRARGIEVDVVGRETVLMERVLGPEVGACLLALHQEHGVRFHLGATLASIDERAVLLASGEAIEGELVVVGVGVHPALELAERAGLAIDRGVAVDRYLQTSVAGIYAAGDIARWPDKLGGEPIRVEHWVVAERSGQVAARNMLGRQEPFDHVPFFWTEQYDFVLGYVGHAERFDRVEIEGSLAERNCKLSYLRDGKTLAVAVVGRDLDGLRSEVGFERAIAAAG